MRERVRPESQVALNTELRRRRRCLSRTEARGMGKPGNSTRRRCGVAALVPGHRQENQYRTRPTCFLRQHYLDSGSTIVGSSCRTLSQEGT